MSDSLQVYFNGVPVGKLWLDQKRRSQFSYDTNWLTATTAIPLSLSLPLQAETFEDDAALPFFANLLPESDVRRALARRLGLSEQNDFALLEAVGGECAGAVSVLPMDTPPQDTSSYQKLSNKALQTLITELPNRPMLAGEKEFRLSLAGAQNKLPVFFDGQAVSLPKGSAPSSHILKPPIRDFQDTVYNEAFCMRLAQAVGLPVPDVTILNGNTPIYLVTRYDRQHNEKGQLERLHQEDFCQALGIPPQIKYQQEGGPGLQDCFRIIRQHSIQPAQDTRLLMQWVLFNYLIGNADGHAKNLSLLLTPSGPKLAPFYDLMCTTVYQGLTSKMAMAIGCEYRPQWMISERWRTLASDIDIGFKLIQKEASKLAETLPTVAAQLLEKMHQEHPDFALAAAIKAVIDRRCRHLVSAMT